MRYPLLHRSLAIHAIVLSLTACQGTTTPLSGQETRILLIGNSLTYWNDMPDMLQAMFDASTIDGYVAAATRPGVGLEDHWIDGAALDSIRQGRWEVVAMQQGPSATEGRPSLIEWSARFADSILAVGARPAMYMVWPAEARSFDFPGVADSYRTAAVNIDGLLFPVGEAWALVWARDPAIELYGPDRFHPTVAASYLAATIIFARVTGLDPDDIDPGIAAGLGIGAAAQDILHAAAAGAIRDFGRD